VSTSPFWNSFAGLRAVLDHIDRGLFAVDSKGAIRFYTAGAARMLGFPFAELIGRPLADFVARADGASLFAQANPDAPAEFEVSVATKDDSHFAAQLTIVAAADSEESPGGFWCILRDRSVEELTTQLVELADTDPLTGLLNRQSFRQRLEEEFRRAARYRLPLALVMLDLDQFKSFNQTFGHPAGDEALRTVARVLKQSARATDVVARDGGQEFAVLLTNTDPDGAMSSAERFRKAIETAPWALQPVTVSVGVASYCHDMAKAPVLLAAAEKARDRAKAGGCNRVEQ
jgi:diguanylate cyclase (GGDEF)-like protein/PAS domain S-box-containing protein